MYWQEEKLALLIIDMQNAFLHERAHLVVAGEDNHPYLAVVPKIKALAVAARRVGVPVTYVRHAYRPGYADGTAAGDPDL